VALFTTQELADYLQADVRNSTATLIHSIVAANITAVYGATLPTSGTVYDQLRGIALAVAARSMDNPTGLLAENVGDYGRRFNAGALELTLRERAQIVQAAGRGGGVYSVPLTTPVDTSYPQVSYP